MMTIENSPVARFARALLAALAMLAFAPQGRAEAVEAVRLSVTVSPEGETVARLALSATVGARAVIRDDPPRILVDFDALVDWSSVDAAPSGPIRAARFGLAAPGRSRMALALARPAALQGVTVAETADGAVLTLALAPSTATPGVAEPPAAPLAPGPALRVAIDPGHGGADPGAVRGGLREKALTLAFARDFAAELEARGVAVALTREDDRFVTLDGRLAAARAHRADVLISIHADVAPDPRARGLSVYVLSSGASDALAAALAENADEFDSIAGAALASDGADIGRVLVGLARADTLRRSRALAEALVGAAGEEVPLLGSRPLRSAGFRVLSAPEIPSALVELGFLSNPTDRARLTDPAWREAALAALADGLLAWRRAEGVAVGRQSDER